MLKNESTYWLPRAQANHAINRHSPGRSQCRTRLDRCIRALAVSRGQELHAVRPLEGLAELGIARQDSAFARKYADKLFKMAEATGMAEMVCSGYVVFEAKRCCSPAI